jgi:hypothetical protein
MPSFLELLQASMPFTAAKAKHATVVELHGDFEAPQPKPINDRDTGMPSPEQILVNRIWRFAQEASDPAVFTNLRVVSRGMGMNYQAAAQVMRKLEFQDLIVTRSDGMRLRLPMTPEFVVGRWWIGMGHIPESDTGWWQLEAATDVSVLVAFVFEDVGGVVSPMTREAIDELGDAFMPKAHVPPCGLEFFATDDASARLCVGNARYLALISLTTCRERSDFAPGDIIGFARFYPHAMIMASDGAASCEVSIRLERPSKAMTHGDPEMMEDVKSLLVADSNSNHSWLNYYLPGMELAVPLTSNIYDYYMVDPDRKLGVAGNPEWVTLADRRFGEKRTVEACVARDGRAFEDITRWPRQGQFDNVHMAPRMRMAFDEIDSSTGQLFRVELDDIAMVFICLHDCVHMHVRWAAWAGDKALKGFENGLAYATSGMPQVPDNQTVLARFVNRHTMLYWAEAMGCGPGEWQVFCHHGAAYAIDAWPGGAADRKRELLKRVVAREDPGDMIFPSMPMSWASFYWRLRFAQDRDAPGMPMERLEFRYDRVLR